MASPNLPFAASFSSTTAPTFSAQRDTFLPDRVWISPPSGSPDRCTPAAFSAPSKKKEVTFDTIFVLTVWIKLM
jgi:hypothetical protein